MALIEKQSQINSQIARHEYAASVLTNKTRFPASASVIAVAAEMDVLPTPPCL
jgi:hypothetical protein